MKARVPDLVEKARVREEPGGPYANYPGRWFGRFLVKAPTGARLLLIVGEADVTLWAACGYPPPAWDHVSVSVRRPDGSCEERTPTWEEMVFVKDLCWDPEECVVQFHPPRSAYVNCHPYCLHLWKPAGVELPRPPAEAVGPVQRDAT